VKWGGERARWVGSKGRKGGKMDLQVWGEVLNGMRGRREAETRGSRGEYGVGGWDDSRGGGEGAGGERR